MITIIVKPSPKEVTTGEILFATLCWPIHLALFIVFTLWERR